MGGRYRGRSRHQMLLIINVCASSEQHAADELLQLAVKGGDIDGQVLAYLEVAQVCPDTDL